MYQVINCDLKAINLFLVVRKFNRRESCSTYHLNSCQHIFLTKVWNGLLTKTLPNCFQSCRVCQEATQSVFTDDDNPFAASEDVNEKGDSDL